MAQLYDFSGRALVDFFLFHWDHTLVDSTEEVDGHLPLSLLGRGRDEHLESILRIEDQGGKPTGSHSPSTRILTV